jgi:uncharacterized protein YndB with AHSA1/START domain
MDKPKFVYVTYIRTTPEKLWHALTDPEFNRRFWNGAFQESEWKVGSSWRLFLPDGRVADKGEILEVEPLRKLVIKWRNEFKPELHAAGFTRMTCELEQQGESVKLTLIHESETPESKMIEAVSKGWPMVLSALKSLLETGESLAHWPKKA